MELGLESELLEKVRVSPGITNAVLGAAVGVSERQAKRYVRELHVRGRIEIARSRHKLLGHWVNRRRLSVAGVSK